MKYVYRINPEGEILGLWNDEILSNTDTKRVRRASEVEFNEVSQRWKVTILWKDSPVVLGEWKTRNEALFAEVEFLNGQLTVDSGEFDRMLEK